MRRWSCTLWLVCLLAAAGFVGVRLAAHDLPTDVLIQTFVKPEGSHLRVLVRVPLNAMADIDYPTRGPGGVLDLTRVAPALRDATTMWVIPAVRVFEDDMPLPAPRVEATRISLPSDRAFASYDEALAHVTGPALAPDVQIYWGQAMLDVSLDYDIRSEWSAFAVRPSFERLGVHVMTTLRFLPPGGAVRALEWSGNPGLVRLDPSWHQAALGFVRLGFAHILGGTDHLLFLMCLVIPVRRFRGLVAVVTAFAVAHSITLLASAVNLAPDALWFPPLIETLIAASILYMALENILAARFGHRWRVAFGFGLVHGFGFSFALRESMQFAGGHLLTSLFAFNIGVELGQLLVLLIVIPPLTWLCRVSRSERLATIVASAVVGHVAWHWMIDRGRALGQYRVYWPDIDAAFAAKTATWLLVLTVAGGVMWIGSLAVARFRPGAPTDPETELTPPR
ncbi:MAG: HupE/UreJ family protein [Acidobacteriota bacterium]